MSDGVATRCKPTYVHHRLRKYARKKFKASDPQALLYWRYWHKAHGGHRLIWKEAT